MDRTFKLFILFIFCSGLSIEVFADSYSSFDYRVHQLTLQSCKSAKIGANNRWQRWSAWINRTGHDNFHHNSNEDTYVSIDFSAFKTRFKNFGRDLPGLLGTAALTRVAGGEVPAEMRERYSVEALLDSPGFHDALNTCFPAGCLPPDKINEIKINFATEFLHQLKSAEVFSATAVTAAVVATGWAAGMAIRGAGAGVRGGLELTHRGASRIAPNAANRTRDVVVRYSPAPETLIAGGLISYMAYEPLRKAYEIGADLDRTWAAIKSMKSPSEVRLALRLDLIDAGFSEATKAIKDSADKQVNTIFATTLAEFEEEIHFYQNEKAKRLAYLEHHKNIDPALWPGPSENEVKEDLQRIEQYIALLKYDFENTAKLALEGEPAGAEEEAALR